MNERRPTCKDVCEQADTLIEAGALEPDALSQPLCGDSEWEELRLHLLLCPPCLEYVRQIGMTIDMLRCLPGRVGETTRASVIEIFERWSGGQRRVGDPDGSG